MPGAAKEVIVSQVFSILTVYQNAEENINDAVERLIRSVRLLDVIVASIDQGILKGTGDFELPESTMRISSEGDALQRLGELLTRLFHEYGTDVISTDVLFELDNQRWRKKKDDGDSQG